MCTLAALIKITSYLCASCQICLLYADFLDFYGLGYLKKEK